MDKLHLKMKGEINRFTRLIERWEKEYESLLKEKKAAVTREEDNCRKIKEQVRHCPEILLANRY